MREIFYAICRSTTFEVLLNTLLAEAVLKNKVKYTKKNVKAIQGADLPDQERTVLERMVFGQKANIKNKHIRELGDYYLSLCIKEGYLKKRFLLGLRKTRHFKNEIRRHLKESFNRNIVGYIDTENTEHLKLIVENIHLIEYPSFISKGSSQIGLYKDMLAMQRAAVDHRFGIQHPPPGK